MGGNSKEYNRAYRLRNMEKARIYAREWAQRNRDKHRAWSARWYRENWSIAKLARSYDMTIGEARQRFDVPLKPR